MPNQNNIYYQIQSGGLCRLHALNNFFGYEKLSQSQFNIIQKKYDVEYTVKFNIDVSCKKFDIVASDQKNVVNYFLKQIGIYTRYYSINQLYLSSSNEIINNLYGDYFFGYNDSHIWGYRRIIDKWFKVDSIGGVSQYDINKLATEKNIGLIVPVRIKQEFNRNLKLIQCELGDSAQWTILNIRNFLIQKHKSKWC